MGLKWTQSDSSLEHSSQSLKKSELSHTLTCLPAVSTISRLARSVRKAYETNVRDKRAGYVGTSWKYRGVSESGIGGRANSQFLNKRLAGWMDFSFSLWSAPKELDNWTHTAISARFVYFD